MSRRNFHRAMSSTRPTRSKLASGARLWAYLSIFPMGILMKVCLAFRRHWTRLGRLSRSALQSGRQVVRVRVRQKGTLRSTSATTIRELWWRHAIVFCAQRRSRQRRRLKSLLEENLGWAARHYLLWADRYPVIDELIPFPVRSKYFWYLNESYLKEEATKRT